MVDARAPQNTYRLVMADGRDVPCTIEFEADGPESALLAAGKHCSGRLTELFENGRSLGMLRNVKDAGFWVITPPSARVAA